MRQDVSKFSSRLPLSQLMILMLSSPATCRQHIAPSLSSSEKISKIVGVISRLRHFVPFCTLRYLYESLILSYLTYGLTAWGQAAKAHLNKLLLLQKRALRLMYFLNPRTHAIPFFISSKILPIHLLYFEAVLHSMYVSNNSAPRDL